MTTSLRRGRQLLALALATSTVAVAAGAAAASASPAATTTTSLYTGSADARAVDVILTLPTNALNAAVPNPAELALIRSTGAVVHNGSATETATSVSDLGSGSLVTTGPLSQVLGPVLLHTVTATLATPNPTPFQLGSPVPGNPLGLSLNLTPLTATTDTATHNTSGTASVANGALASLNTIAPQVAGPLGTGLTTVNTNLSLATGQLVTGLMPVGTTVSPLTGPLGSALAGTPLAGAADPIGALTTGLTSVAPLFASVQDELINGAALSLDGLTSSEGITPAGTTSTGAADVATASLFGGLVQLQATKGSATATANGTAGQGAATSNAAVVTASAGTDLTSLLTAVVNDQGITAGLLSSAAPALGPALQPIIAGINTALLAVRDAINSLNVVHIVEGTATHSTTADGTHAEAHATPALVSVDLPGAPGLVALSLGGVDVIANRTNTTTTTTVAAPVKPKAPTVHKAPAKPLAPTKKLAYTGADLPLTAGLALALLGAATVLTRRRRSSSDS